MPVKALIDPNFVHYASLRGLQSTPRILNFCYQGCLAGDLVSLRFPFAFPEDFEFNGDLLTIEGCHFTSTLRMSLPTNVIRACTPS
jgi:hypothetical protein